MAITFVQTAALPNTASATSPVAIAFANNNQAGSLLVASGRVNANTGPIITDSGGNTWVVQIANNWVANSTFFMAYALNAIAGANTVTFTNGGNQISAVMQEYAGIATSNALDGFASASSASWTVADSGNVTTTVNGDLIVGGQGIVTPSSFSTPGAGYSNYAANIQTQATLASLIQPVAGVISAKFFDVVLSGGCGVMAFKPLVAYSAPTFRSALAASVGSIGTNTNMITPAYNQVAGNLIVVGTINYSGGGIISGVSDTAGNTFTTVYAGSGYIGAGTIYKQIWYAKNCLGNANNAITAIAPGTITFSGMYYYDVFGADKTSPIDVSDTGFYFANVYEPQTKLFTTTQSNELLISLFSGDSGYYQLGPLNVTQIANTKTATMQTGSIPANFTQETGSTWLSDATSGTYNSVVTADTTASLRENSIWASDQYAECVQTETTDNPGTNPRIGPAVRINAAGTKCYWLTQIGSSLYLSFTNAGINTTLASVSRAYVQGEMHRIVVVGTNIYAYVNGILILYASDSSLTSGNPGLFNNGPPGSLGPALGTCTTWAAGTSTETVVTASVGVGQGGLEHWSQTATFTSVQTNALSSFFKIAGSNQLGMVGVTIKQAVSAAIAYMRVFFIGSKSG